MNNLDSWGKYSDEYYQNASFDVSTIHLGLGLPGFLPEKLVGGNMRVIDIGCGNGVNTNLMASVTRNAVVGIDPAEQAIKQAIKHYVRPNLSFFCCDLLNPVSIVSDTAYDLITFFGSLDYIPLGESFFDILSSISRKGTKCLISKFHPFWTTLFGNDVEEERDLNYFDDGREDNIAYGVLKKYYFTRYHYTMSFLINEFAKHSWHLNKIEEPSPNFKDSSFKYKGYEEDEIMIARLRRFPMTLILELEKEA